MTMLITDYLENTSKKVVDKIIHIEDSIEMHPTDQQRVLVTYSLYKVKYLGSDEEYFVQIESESSNLVIPANRKILDDLFPDFVRENLTSDNPTSGGAESVGGTTKEVKE